MQFLSIFNGVSRLVNSGCPISSGSDTTHPNGTECQALILIKVAVLLDIHSFLNTPFMPVMFKIDYCATLPINP